MGVPGLFQFIRKHYPVCVERVDDRNLLPVYDSLFIDANAIIHDISHADGPTSNVSYEVLAARLFSELDHLISFINPQKFIFIAIDGTVPRCKLNQQRRRRYQSCAMQSQNEINEELFDANVISPGTVFMERLNEIIKFYIQLRMEKDPAWKKLKVLYSSYRYPGEGEHKIMEYLRCSINEGHYDDKERNMIYGSDMDLVLLASTLHRKNIDIIRNDFIPGSNTDETPNDRAFFIFHPAIFSEIITMEVSTNPAGLSDSESIMTDFIFLTSFCGNDFLPQLPFLHVGDNFLPFILQLYKTTLEFMKTYLISNQTPSSDFLNQLYSLIAKTEENSFAIHKDQYVESLIKLTSWKIKNCEDYQLLTKYTSALKRITPDMSFKEYRDYYYLIKLDIDCHDETSLKHVCAEYSRGLLWNYHYYFKSVPSWSYVFGYYYAPFASDLMHHMEYDSTFEYSHPLTPLQHLFCCLPPSSSNFLPPSYKALVTDSDSPLSKYFVTEYITDLNGKNKSYEAIALIPILNEKEILQVLEDYQCDSSLTEEEKIRNSYEDCYLFAMSKDSHVVSSSLDPVMFPSIEECHVKSYPIPQISSVFQYFGDYPHGEEPYFPTILDYCSSVTFKSDDSANQNNHSLVSPSNTILNITVNDPTQSSLTPELLREMGQKCGNGIIEYGFPSRHYGIMKFLLTEKYKVVNNKGKWEPTEMSPKDKGDYYHAIKSIQRTAIEPSRFDPYEAGFMDISKSYIIAAIVPIVSFAYGQVTTSTPVFGNSHFYYPFCFVRVPERMNLLNTALRPSFFDQHSYEVGDPVVLGSQFGQQSGYAGVITRIEGNTFTVSAQTPDEVERIPIEMGNWYSLEEVKSMVNVSHLKELLGYQWIKEGKTRYMYTMDLLPSYRGKINGLVRCVLNCEKEHLPSSCFARISYDSIIGEKEYMFSERAVELIKQFFKRFGEKLSKGVSFNGGKVFPKRTIITMEFAMKVEDWVKKNIHSYGYSSATHVEPPDGYVEELEKKTPTKKNEVIEVSGDETKFIFKKAQYTIKDEIILSQSMELLSIGRRVVIVNHPNIPHGARGTIIGIDYSSYMVDVLLDYPVLEGVCKKGGDMNTPCMGRKVYVAYY